MRLVIPIALACAVERFGWACVTTTAGRANLRRERGGEDVATGRHARRRRGRAAQGRPRRGRRRARGRWRRAPACRSHGRAWRSSGSRPVPPTDSVLAPSRGSCRIAASCRFGSHHEAEPSCIRTGRASAVRTCAATGARSAARTVGASTRTGSATRPRWKPARACTIVSPACSRSSTSPVRAGTTTGRRPRRTIAACSCERFTVFAMPGDLEVKGPLEHAGRRRDVRAEDAHADPAEAADRADAVALVERQLDGRVPVGLDAEAHRPQRPLMTGGREGDRHPGERVGAALELRAGLARGQAADVDAVDLDPGRDPGRGAGEDEAEHGTAHRDDDRQHNQPLNEQRPGTAATSAADPDRTSPCLDAQERGV